MPQMSEIMMFRQVDQPTLIVRIRTSVEDLPQVIGESYGKIGQYLQELGEMPTDIPFVGYHNMDMQNLDVEIGFPVASALPEREGIKAGLIPAGYAVSSVYRGPYQEMAPLYNDMAAWIDTNGYFPAGPVYEHYLNGPGFPESELLTKIVMPVLKK